MKTIKIFLFAGMLIASASTTKAQLLSAGLPATEKVADAVASSGSAAKFSSASVMVNKGGIRAVKDFTSRFKDGADVKWIAEDKVISAWFNRDGINNTIVYDNKGRWIRNMRVYYESQMPKNIRALVRKSEYYDYNIKLVQEITEGDLLFYVVHLEDDKTCKQIAVYNDEIKLLSKFNKNE